MAHAQKFGGIHTEIKLDTLSQYLSSYTNVMKNQKFTTHYVDGFAGSGSSYFRKKNHEGQSDFDFDLSDNEVFITGSPVRAMNVTPPFDHYYFIEKNGNNVKSLEELKSSLTQKNVKVIQDDANVVLQKFANWLNTKPFDRAVVFLDPFGLSVKWETIKLLGDTNKVDLWYLVPVHGMSRQIRRDGKFLPSAGKIDELWGSTDWRTKAVETQTNQCDLFGETQITTSKKAEAQMLSTMFQKRLGDAFKGGVAENYLKLGHRSHHIFSLMFACANPSPPAAGAALRIANSVLKRR